jgi:hypothetical protein
MKVEWGYYVSTPGSNSNCDFTPCFSTLWFYPCDLKTKQAFAIPAPGFTHCYLEPDFGF